MTYEETLNWLYTRLPMFQRQGKAAYKADLSNTYALCEALGNPQEGLKYIHVAGTNGKGSSSHMLASVLQAAGYKVGLHTSPHLIDFRERVKINGQMISKEAVTQFVAEYKTTFEKIQPSFFEIVVAMAFHHFNSEQVDYAIMEVGMGGRLDSTNIIDPVLCLITNIGLDHTQFLGNTIEEIAGEKAGIIKSNVPVIISQFDEATAPIFTEKALKEDAPIFFANEIEHEFITDLLGEYQSHNLKGVVGALATLDDPLVTIKEMQEGLSNVQSSTGLRGRYEKRAGLRCPIILDTAHNEAGLSHVIPQLSREVYESLHIVLGTVSDKDIQSILRLFPKEATYYFCEPDIPRALALDDLKQQAGQLGLIGGGYATVKKAVEAAEQNSTSADLIYVGGSTFVVAEAY